LTPIDPQSVSKLMVRATNWVGDAIMSLPAIRAIRGVFPQAELVLVARPWVADVYARETAIDRIVPYQAKTWRERLGFGLHLGKEGFDCAILLQNAFDAAAMAWLSGAPLRLGYARDGRSFLLTHPIPTPGKGEIPRHERFYYLELLRRAGLLPVLPECAAIRLENVDVMRASGRKTLDILQLAGPAIGVSPGAAYGDAKRWLPERFAEAAIVLARERGARVFLFGSQGERELADRVKSLIKAAGVEVHNFAGQTSLSAFIEYAANCGLFLTNDSGAMHVASALGVPTVTVFGATDDEVTGPTGPLARIVREPVDCSPCLLRDCPTDHRCMTRVSADRVIEIARQLPWTPEARS
jgi:heptosyltransferase-2